MQGRRSEALLDRAFQNIVELTAVEQPQTQGQHEVEVQVKSLKTNDKTHFKIAATATLSQVWAEAINPQRLDEQRGPGDTFRCDDGTDLTGRLDTTLAQLAAEGICHERHFEIRGPSGGA